MRNLFDKLDSRLPAFVRMANPIAWSLIWVGAIGLAMLVHLAFLVHWPDHFVHEDSAAYLDEAQSILTGHYVDDPGRRPYGVALFLVLLSKLFSPNILVFVVAQHLLSILSAILIAAAVRFAGAPRICSLLAFFLAALYGRTIHYDNTVGAETISVFLMSLPVFIASGVAFRKWPPFLSAIAIGLSLGAAMLCRSATVGAAVVILLWLAMSVDIRWIRRLGVVALAGGIAAAVYLAPNAVNRIVGKHPAGSESVAVMAFIVGYSGDFDHGVHLDRKAQARQFVNEKRATDGPLGWGVDTGEYQWPFGALNLMRRPTDSDADIEKVVRDIFIETLTTPSTLWRHLSKYFAREMYFLLFDGNVIARKASDPQGYEFFVKRDAFPFFKSPTGFKPGSLIFNYYSPPKKLSWLLPTATKLQARLDALMTYGYLPRPDRAPLCCRLTISSEYDDLPGPIRWLSASMLILLATLLVGEVVGRSGWLPPLPRNLVAIGTLMVLLALINAAFPAFLIYGLNRYAYCVTPFMAGAAGVLFAVLLDRVRLIAVNWPRGVRAMSVVEQAG
ncbi:hypothetical protein SAMN05444158_0997 [Bradyrhizobium canariense]|uniref:Glycosyltransferase RgtA/B/C/D-like domain-containing protein n=2 Tax=Bradyrhizobium canariense TaxID=255045 RepID=A0A1H1PFG2_9BRAD|nr:hypothetical protein SAMN05444158_0997 [Bradyrhizobium canariense]